MTQTQTQTQTQTASQKPGPRVLTDDELSRLLREQRFGVLASVRRSGHPHLSTVLYHWDPDDRIVRISTTADRLKVRQLRHDPHAALHVNGPDVWSFAVAEGEAEVSEPTTVPGDAVGRELLALAPGSSFDELVAERRVVIRIRVSRLYGTALDIPAPAPAEE